MNAPKKTFELKISFGGDADHALATKENVMGWLSGVGVDSFVEGTIDGLDLDHDYARPPEVDPFFELGGGRTPLLIYKYEKEALVDLLARLQQEFGDSVTLELGSLDTKVWQEGWKESFTPIYTDRFVVYPPWESYQKREGLLPICIEPGMAFGTGQHATTVLCLQLLESVWKSLPNDPLVADIGAGTGVLAIAASKLGAMRIFATDIDADAVRASCDNALRNQVKIDVSEGSVPPKISRGYQLVFANILAVVLEKLLPDMSRVLADGGKLIMSGILEEQADSIRHQAAGLGLQLTQTKTKSGWVAMCLEKSA